MGAGGCWGSKCWVVAVCTASATGWYGYNTLDYRVMTIATVIHNQKSYHSRLFSAKPSWQRIWNLLDGYASGRPWNSVVFACGSGQLRFCHLVVEREIMRAVNETCRLSRTQTYVCVTNNTERHLHLPFLAGHIFLSWRLTLVPSELLKGWHVGLKILDQENTR